MDNTKESPTILSLCTGYGGLERGIESVVGKCTGLAYVEIEAFAVANLVNKMETGKLDPVPVWTDLKTFNARIFRGRVDFLTGGYPCQPFSAAGKRNGTDDPRHLWPYIRTIIMDCKPRKCFFENVEGHLTLGISEVLSDLEAMGYRVAVGIFSAVEVGAPHQRKRVFILADSCDTRSGNNTGSPGSETGAEILRQGDGAKRSVWINSAGADKKLGDSADFRLCGSGKDSGEAGTNEKREECGLHEFKRTGALPRNVSFQKWPSRPGEPQHEWEAPRVVANAESERDADRQECTGGLESYVKGYGRKTQPELADSDGDATRGNRKHSGELGFCAEGGDAGRHEREPEQQENGNRQVKPELGRTIDGTRNRVDRLRLLGNGVVWQTAAKAFFTLSQKL